MITAREIHEAFTKAYNNGFDYIDVLHKHHGWLMAVGIIGDIVHCGGYEASLSNINEIRIPEKGYNWEEMMINGGKYQKGGFKIAISELGVSLRVHQGYLEKWPLKEMMGWKWEKIG